MINDILYLINFRSESVIPPRKSKKKEKTRTQTADNVPVGKNKIALLNWNFTIFKQNYFFLLFTMIHYHFHIFTQNSLFNSVELLSMRVLQKSTFTIN